MNDFDLTSYLTQKRNLVDTALKKLLPGEMAQTPETKNPLGAAVTIVPQPLSAALSYSLLANGKRLRPILCIAAAEAVGGSATMALPAACALEMIHTYSLIHDDLPAMDNDDLRRGKPTCHVAFDEATAVLAGDALLTLAFEVLSTAGLNSSKQSHCQSHRRADHWLKVTAVIARAAGAQGMIAGQMLDMSAEGQSLDRTALENLHACKTGALIEAALTTGAILGGDSEQSLQQLRRYARKIGLAFQVTDDILNVEGDPQVMGKAVGTDQEREKCTYPALMGLDNAKAFASELITGALQALADFDNRSDPLRAIARYIIERKR